MKDWKNRITGYGEESPDQLLANPHNHRIHPKRQQDALGGSLDTLGYIQTVIVNKTTGHIVDGHLRVSMALREGQKSIPVTYVELSVEEEAQALLSIDPIAAMAATDKDKVDELLRMVNTDNDQVMKHLSDFAAENKLEWGQPEKSDAEPQIDLAAELLEKWQVKTGDLWQIGEHRLLCGDSTKREDVGRVMGGEKADMVFTDPPYNVKYSGRGQNTSLQEIENDDMPDEEFYDWLLSACRLIGEFSVDSAPYYLCHRDTGNKALPFMKVFEDCNWKRSATIIWVKNAASMGWQDYRSQHECISYGWKDNGKHYFTESRSETTIWDISRDAQSTYAHPTQKPVALPEKAIKNSSVSGAVLYEPFAGSGTTLVACQNLQRKCRAIEISPAYCSVILERMQTAFPGIEIKRLVD